MRNAKPVATLTQLDALKIPANINWITKGKVFGIEAVNHLYRILSDPVLTATLDAEVAKISVSGYVASPPDLFTAMGVKDAAEFIALSPADKRFRFMTYWYLKPLSSASKFGQGERFLLGETNWIASTPYDHTTEYILSKTLGAARTNDLFNAKTILAATALNTDHSIVNFLKQDRLRMVYQVVKTQLPATMDNAWHLANAPVITTSGNEIDTLDKLIQYSVYFFDAMYPGLKPAVAAVSGDTTIAVNAARAAVYDSFVGACKTASVLSNDISNTFAQYRMNFLMEEAIKTYKTTTNPRWSETAAPLKYSDTKITEYAFPTGTAAFMPYGLVNDIIDMAIEMESWPSKYAAALPANPTIATLFGQDVLGGILNEIGLATAKIVASPASPSECTEKQALFQIAFQLLISGRKLSDAYIPTYPQATLDTYSLTADLLSIYGLSSQEIAMVYGFALDIETDLKTNLAMRTADLTAAFDGNAAAVTAATEKQKAGKMALYFYTLSRQTSATQVNVGVIKPKAYSRYIGDADAGIKVAVEANRFNNAGLQNGLYDSFSVAHTVQKALFTADLTAGSPTTPTKYAEVIKSPLYTGDNAAKADYLALYVASAEFGLIARNNLKSYFQDKDLGNIVRAKINDADIKKVDDRVTAEVNFVYTATILTKYGFTGSPTKTEVAKRVFMDELVQKKVQYYDNLYQNTSLSQHLMALGVDDAALESINLNFDQVNLNPSQWNSEVIGVMLFSHRYGQICDLADSGCTTGWASNLALAEIVYPLGLTRKAAMSKGYSLLEVLQMADNFKTWKFQEARNTPKLKELFDSSVLGGEAV